MTANSTVNSTYFRGQGLCWIAPRNSSGISGGFVPIGDADKLDISFKETFDDARESVSGLRRRVVHSSIQSDVDFSLDVMNFSGFSLATALLGTSAPLVSGTASAEAHVATPGSAIFLKYPNVSSVVVKDHTDTTTYVSGTDYLLDATTGRLDVITGGAITSGSVVHVNYSYSSAAAVVEALTNLGNREVAIVFAGLNMNQQATPVIVSMWRVYLNLAASVNFLGTATQKFSISGALLPATEITDGSSQFFRTTVVSQNASYAV